MLLGVMFSTLLSSVELVMGLYLVVALGADDDVLAERSKTRRLVLLLAEHQFARVTPTLFVFGIITILNESKWHARICDEMAAHRCDDHRSVPLAMDRRNHDA